MPHVFWRWLVSHSGGDLYNRARPDHENGGMRTMQGQWKGTRRRKLEGSRVRRFVAFYVFVTLMLSAAAWMVVDRYDRGSRRGHVHRINLGEDPGHTPKRLGRYRGLYKEGEVYHEGEVVKAYDKLYVVDRGFVATAQLPLGIVQDVKGGKSGVLESTQGGR